MRAGTALPTHPRFRVRPGVRPGGGGRRAFVVGAIRFEESAAARRAVVGGLTLAFACAALFLGPSAHADELQGSVRDGAGLPVAGADFDVYDLDGNKLAPSDNTDAAGRYGLVLAAGRYDVLVQPLAGSGVAPMWTRNVDVAGTTTLDWVLPPAFRQLGRTRDAGGAPVGAVRVEFDRVPDGERSPALGNLSSPFGTFAAYVAHGTYTVTATPPEATGLAPARISPWPMPTPDTLDFMLVPAARLSGSVRDGGGAPVAGVRLAFDGEADGARVPSAENRTATDGSYRARVAPGTYRVLYEAPRDSRLASRRVAGVDLAADAVLDVTLEQGVLVSGRVFDASGAPLVGADWDVADEATGTSVPTPGDNTDADGRYVLVLPVGRYRLTLTPPMGAALDTVVLRNVGVTRDSTLDWSYASGGAPPPPSALALAPLGNPTYRTARIRMALPEAAEVRVELFDAAGRRVRVLAQAPLPAGLHELAWDGRRENGADAHTGVYFVRATAGSRRGITRFVLLPRPPAF